MSYYILYCFLIYGFSRGIINNDRFVSSGGVGEGSWVTVVGYLLPIVHLGIYLIMDVTFIRILLNMHEIGY